MARNDWKLLPDIIKEFHEKSTLTNEQVIRGTFIKLAGAIAEDTPVDEGITRANWYITAGQPSSEYNPDTKKPNKGETEFENELNRIDDVFDDNLFLTNNSPNILVIENGGYVDSEGNPANGPKTTGGFSSKSPNGMVAVNLKRFSAIIKEEGQ